MWWRECPDAWGCQRISKANQSPGLSRKVETMEKETSGERIALKSQTYLCRSLSWRFLLGYSKASKTLAVLQSLVGNSSLYWWDADYLWPFRCVPSVGFPTLHNTPLPGGRKCLQVNHQCWFLCSNETRLDWAVRCGFVIDSTFTKETWCRSGLSNTSYWRHEKKHCNTLCWTRAWSSLPGNHGDRFRVSGSWRTLFLPVSGDVILLMESSDCAR